MKKIIIAVIVAGVIVVGIFLYKNKIASAPQNSSADYKHAAYLVEGQPVTLIDKDYFGNEAMGDLNHDGVPDVAFIFTQNNGGSGTFYYVAVALKSSSGYIGTNAMFLGDRIAPQTTEIKDGELIVNYADRKPSEPMVARPSVGVTKYLKIVGNSLVTS